MKKTKWISLLLAMALCLAFTGCIGNFYENAGTVDGRKISSGLYLSLQYNAYTEGKSKVEDPEADPFKQKIDGVKFKDWVNTRTEELLRQFVCVERLAAEKEVVLGEENKGYLEQMAGYWDVLKEQYEANGISYDTMMLTMANDMLADELFKAMYASGGDLAPSDEEIRAEYEAKFGQIEYIMLPFNANTGEASESKEPEVMAVAEEMKTKLENGGDFKEVAAEGLEKVYGIIGREFSAENVDSSISTSFIEYEGEDNDESYPPEFRAQLKGMAEGEYGIHKMSSLILVYRVIPTFADDAAFTEARDTAVNSLYRDSFDQYLAETYNAYPVSWEPGARFYFRPEKIVTQ